MAVVAIGYLLAGEPLTRRAILGTLLELASSVVIATSKTKRQQPGPGRRPERVRPRTLSPGLSASLDKL